MKKILGLILLALLVTSCYKDYVKDFTNAQGLPNTTIYFPYQYDVRTVVVGEGMNYIKVGVTLGGTMNNVIDRTANYTLDNTLITPAILASMKTGATYIKNAVANTTTLLPMPVAYYSLSNASQMIIHKGLFEGDVTLSLDSTKFLADPLTLNGNYCIPFWIQNAQSDSLIQAKRSNVVCLKYENMLFGNYWHGGITIRKDATGKTIDTVKYYTTIPTPEAKIWILKTVAPWDLIVNGYSDQVTTKTGGEFKISLSGTNVVISSVAGSTFVVTPNGTSTFNKPKLLQDRKLFLNYTYVNGTGLTCYAKDTLTFRNRLQDGVNIWQDENPAHYLP